MPGKLSTYAQNKLVAYQFSAAAYTPAATLYYALFNVVPAPDGTGGTEVTGTSYARIGKTNNNTQFVVSGAGVTNGATVDFGTAGGSWGTVNGAGLYDNPTAGNLIAVGDLTVTDYAFEADASTDVFACPGHPFVNGDTVRLGTVKGGTLPTGVTTSTTYYIINASAAVSFKLSASSGGSAIDITVSGTGCAALLSPKPIATGDGVQFATSAFNFLFV